MIAQNSEIHRMQHAFRSAMEALAHPGRVCTLPIERGKPTPTGLESPLDTVVRMFVDQAVTFAYLGDAVKERAIAAETRSRATGAAKAAFVVVPFDATEPTVSYAVGKAAAGTPVSPEKGATVMIGCERLSQEPAEGLAGFYVSGPGVSGRNEFYCTCGVWERARSARLDEYPLGMEILLVDVEGRVVAIPRSSAIVPIEASGDREVR